MARSLLLFASMLLGTGCYMSHRVGDDGGTHDGGRDAGCTLGSRCLDASVLDLGPRHDSGPPPACVPGAREPVPCGRCGSAVRICTPTATWGVPAECAAERERCPVDVMLLADITGSHTSFFRSSEEVLTNQLVVPLEMDADVRFGVSGFADYPVGGYGDSEDRPFLGVLAPTHDVTSVASAISTIMFFGGGDGPEAEIEGLNDLVGLMPHPTAAPFACPADTLPGGCWRPDATWRVIIVMTDVASHSLPDTHGGLVEPYGPDLIPPAPSWPVVRDALVASGTYVYWIVPSSETVLGMVSASVQARALAAELGEDPDEAVATYDGDPSFPVIATRMRIVDHFGIRVAP